MAHTLEPLAVIKERNRLINNLKDCLYPHDL